MATALSNRAGHRNPFELLSLPTAAKEDRIRRIRGSSALRRNPTRFAGNLKLPLSQLFGVHNFVFHEEENTKRASVGNSLTCRQVLVSLYFPQKNGHGNLVN